MENKRKYYSNYTETRSIKKANYKKLTLAEKIALAMATEKI